MTQSKTIKIFLASSITELKFERLFLGDYIMNSVRPIFKYDGIEVELFKCEDTHTGNTGKCAQKEIDDVLKDSNISVFLFKKEAGPDTIHEFKVARKLQKTKPHEIYVYTQDIPDDERSDELKEFLSQLAKQKKSRLYWKTFEDVDSIEKQFVLGLLEFERKLLGFKADSDVEQESETEKDGDDRIAKYLSNETKQALLSEKQAQLREMIHQDIDDLLLQAKSVMKDESDTIAARIFKAKELYEKADRWASKTNYNKKKYSDLLFDYAQFLYKYGLYQKSEAVYLRQISLAEELYGTEHEKTATSYNNIGLVYWKQGDYPQALEYYFKALEIYEKVLGTEHPSTATSYNNIGTTYHAQGDYPQALEYFFKALKIQEKVLGKEHSDTATSYNNIGGVCHELREYDMARDYYFIALKIREKVLGIEHPQTADSYNNIGGVYDKQGDYRKALEYYSKASKIFEKVFGKEHPHTASSYNNIGLTYLNQGDYPKALDYYFKTKEIKEKILGKDHPETGAAYTGIGVLYYKTEKYDKALEYLNKAQEIYNKKKLKPNHPYTQNTQRWIEAVHAAMGKK